jgi:hypothetical protein
MGDLMAWTIFHGRGRLLEAGQSNPGATGWVIDTRRTEQEAIEYACALVRQGRGVHSIWNRGSDQPKYRHDDIVAMVNRDRNAA